MSMVPAQSTIVEEESASGVVQGIVNRAFSDDSQQLQSVLTDQGQDMLNSITTHEEGRDNFFEEVEEEDEKEEKEEGGQLQPEVSFQLPSWNNRGSIGDNRQRKSSPGVLQEQQLQSFGASSCINSCPNNGAEQLNVVVEEESESKVSKL